MAENWFTRIRDKIVYYGMYSLVDGLLPDGVDRRDYLMNHFDDSTEKPKELSKKVEEEFLCISAFTISENGEVGLLFNDGYNVRDIFDKEILNTKYGGHVRMINGLVEGCYLMISSLKGPEKAEPEVNYEFVPEEKNEQKRAD